MRDDFFSRAAADKVVGVSVEAGRANPHARGTVRVRLAAPSGAVLTTEISEQTDAAREAFRALLASGVVAVFFDAKKDIRHLLACGISSMRVFDIMLAAQLLGDFNANASPEAFARRYIGVSFDEAEEASDPRLLLRLRDALVPELKSRGLVRVARIEFDCARAVAHMEYYGINLDRAKWDVLYKQTCRARDNALASLQTYMDEPALQTDLWGGIQSQGINLLSNAQARALLSRHGIDVASTSKRALSPYRDHPLVKLLREYRRACKAISTFLLPIPEMINPATGRLHPTYWQMIAFSGRMSCFHPNIQQIPRDPAFRACFTAPPGRRLIIADYSQIELRVAAQIADDRRMLEAYQRGEDLHLLTASRLSGKPMNLISRQERQAYKAVNLGLIYGMGARGLKETSQLSYGVDISLEQANAFREGFFKTYPGIAAWHQRLRETRSREGRTLTGRSFHFREGASLPERSNMPVQGTAADIIKKALGMLVERLEGRDIRIVAAVHDEILLECGEREVESAARILESSMCEAAESILPDVPTPVQAAISLSWAEK